MRKRASKLTVIGAAIGLVLAGAAIAPANAAPVPTTLTATSCSAFKGATATGSSVGFSGVALKGGDTITTTVSPAGATDTISVTGSLGLNIILGGGPASGTTFRAPADGYYNLTFIAEEHLDRLHVSDVVVRRHVFDDDDLADPDHSDQAR